MIHPATTRTVTFGFETEEQARRFDEAMTCQTANLPRVQHYPGSLDLALTIEIMAARAIDDRPFSGSGDPNVFPPKVEIVGYDGAQEVESA